MITNDLNSLIVYSQLISTQIHQLSERNSQLNKIGPLLATQFLCNLDQVD